ncbi:glutamine amidotransferase [Candidatus Saccharibacteria bacterium]|nr:MAG: glutamine amidotransferase [Candidatus Saccharibacteria bacterium]
MSRPFILIQSRPENEASDDEYQAFLKFGNLEPEQLHRVRVDAGEQPALNLDNYSGVIMGGGPANFAYDDSKKDAGQQRFEAYVLPLLKQIIAHDKPFLGACLGVGALVSTIGSKPSFDYSEAVGAVDIELTNEGLHDDLAKDLPKSFKGFVGHKEGVKNPPAECVVLANSETCVQMLRIGNNVYATQFHPELDAEGLALRIGVYKHAGYFAPEEADQLIAEARAQTITEPVKILKTFVEKYHS